MQERAVEEVKLAIKPFYQRRDVTKQEYKDILRKAVQKVGAGGWSVLRPADPDPRYRPRVVRPEATAVLLSREHVDARGE